MNGQHAWQFYTTSETAWEAMLDSCRRATTSIDLEQYVFGGESRIERQFADVFKEKKKEGVRVRLLLDAVGSHIFYRSALYEELKSSGIEITFHRGVFPASFKRIVLPFMMRNHRKLLVVDEREAHIGGVIIQERARDWRDTAVRIEGRVVRELEDTFEVLWKHCADMRPVGAVFSKNPKAEFSIVGNSYHLHDKLLYRQFLRHIVTAKKSVYITTPYFSPNREFRRALYFAQARGVDVRILLPKWSDNFFADMLGRLYYERLIRHGIRIFLYTPSVLHAKTIAVDGTWASVGSCNFDWLSFWLNYELNINSTNFEFSEELHNQFLLDLEGSEEVIALKSYYLPAIKRAYSKKREALAAQVKGKREENL